MSEHIPGPWFVEKNEDNRLTVRAPDGDNMPWSVADIIGSCGFEVDTSKANARLIAAAPDLLVALEALVDDAIHHEDGDDRGMTLDITIGRAEEVIARAKGRD